MSIVAPTPPRDVHVPDDFGHSYAEFRDQQQGHLPVISSFLTAVGVGGLLGVPFLRPRGGGWSRTAMLSGARLGAGTGAGAAVALIAVDRITGGALEERRRVLAENGRHQAWLVMRNAHRPWVATEARAVATEALVLRGRVLPPYAHLDGPPDAFTHGWATATYALRAHRDHGVSLDAAIELARTAGQAHEYDAASDPNDARRVMDLHNNEVGASVLRESIAASPDALPTEEQLAVAVVDAMRAGRLLIANESASGLRFTTAADADGASG